MESERLQIFRDLAKANEEQSMVDDVMVVLSNPLPLIVGGVMLILAYLSPASPDNTLSKQDRKNPHNSKPAYPSWKLVAVLLAGFQILHSIHFDLGIKIIPLSLLSSLGSDSNNQHQPGHNNETASAASSPIYKPYTNYTAFYEEAYVDAHVEYASRASHLVLASSVVALCLWDTRLLAASMVALLTGALCTIPLAGVCDCAFLEMSLVLVVGMTISKLCYNTMVRWLVFFVVWMSMDYLDHFLLGHNGSAAIYIGQHYLSWGLIGQLQLAFGMIVKGAVS